MRPTLRKRILAAISLPWLLHEHLWAEAAQAWLDKTLNAQLAQAHQEDKQSQAKIQRIAHIFRFLCPSYWIPGKQDWGAF